MGRKTEEGIDRMKMCWNCAAKDGENGRLREIGIR